MRYFYYGKGTEEGLSARRKNNTEFQSSSVETKTYAQESDLVIEEDTIYEVDRMCLSRRQGKSSKQ